MRKEGFRWQVGSRSLRHWFSTQHALRGETIDQLQFWRGDKAFTTGWVGSAPDANVPVLLYPLNLLLWSLSFHLMSFQIGKDNPDIREAAGRFTATRIIMYAGYAVSIALSFILPAWSMRMVGIVTIIIVIRLIISKRADSDL